MTAFERWSIWVSSVLVTVTGGMYLGMKYLLPEPAGFSIIRHPLQPLVLNLHIITAPLLLFAIGAVAVRHIWRHLVAKTPQGRRTGWSVAIVTIPMIFTGYCLQVFTSEGWLRGLAIGHIATGVVYGGGLFLHQIMVRRGRTGVGPVQFPVESRRTPRPMTRARSR